MRALAAHAAEWPPRLRHKPTARAAAVFPRGCGRPSSHPRSACRGFWRAVERERRQAPMAMLGAAIRRDALARELESVEITARLGVDDPACELRQAGLEVALPDRLEGQHAQR